MLSNVYVVVDNYNGKHNVFIHKNAAKDFVELQKKIVHQTQCIDRLLPTNCLCTSSRGKETCAAHVYATNLDRDGGHAFKQCRETDGWIYIKRAKLNK